MTASASMRRAVCPDGSTFDGVDGLEKALLARPEVLRVRLPRADYVCIRARCRDVRCAGGSDGGAVRRREGLQVFVFHFGNCQQYSVSDEEVTVIITKRLCRAGRFCAGWGPPWPAVAGCDGAVDDCARGYGGAPGAQAGLRVHSDGRPHAQMDSPGEGTRRTVADSASAGEGRRPGHGGDEPGTEECVSGNSRHSQLLIPERGHREMDREQRLLPGHDGGPDRRTAYGARERLPSLELAMDLLTTVGQCDNGYACVYQNNLSWSSPTTPLPAEAHPRVAFSGSSGTEASAGSWRNCARARVCWTG